MNDATPTIGDNSKSFYAELFEQRDEVVATTNKWLLAFKGKPITDEEAARRCHDFIAKVKTVIDVVEEKRVTLRKPVILESNMIDEEARETKQPLQVALTLLEKLELAWKQLLRNRQAEAVLKAAEAARTAKAESDRLAALAQKATTVEEVVAAEKAQERVAETMTTLQTAMSAKPIVRGDFATRGSGIRTIWSARIDDLEGATNYYLGHAVGKAKILEVIQALADKDAKALKREDLGIPGVKGISEER